jgi:4-amino-4-deoxy-L-arabinose transferase-like glycosyltransferase
MHSVMRTQNRIAVAIFATVAALLLTVHGHRVVMTNDEGIILESAQRMVSGSRIYVDFFGYMSPGSYWLQALVFRLLGISFLTGRLIVILDFAAQCALVYWLVTRLASWRAAVAATLTFFGFQVADPAFLTSAHRWDSATFALSGLCLAVSALDCESSWARWTASGGALAAAIWCTPSMGIVAAVIAIWMAWSPTRRKNLAPWLGGAAAAGSAGVLLLLSTGSLRAFFTQMAWLRQNYSAVNVLPYGSIIGGYRALLEGSAGPLETAVRLALVACVALPAMLPPLAILLGAIEMFRLNSQRHRDTLMLLIPSVAAMALTVFPRADVMHLAFVAALPYAVAGCALANLLPARPAGWVALGSLTMAAVFASNYARGWQDTVRLDSSVGTLRLSGKQALQAERLLQHVLPSDTLFVYPYMPMHYFLTQAKNPTRYSYLMPGMMTESQASEALSELQARPPEWLLFMQLSPQDFMRVFPNGTGLNWRFADLESWMQAHYRPADPPVTFGGYQLWRRTAAPPSATSALR